MKIIQKTIVKENFLFPSFFSRLTRDIENSTIDWYWEDKTIPVGEDDRHCMFATVLFDKFQNTTSKWFPIFEPFLYFLHEEVSFTTLLKMKMNLYVNHTVQHVHAKHIDLYNVANNPRALDFITAVFNFTDCDGFTQIEDKKYPSKANSIIIFDGKNLHQVATPTNTKKRVVLNINVL